METSIPLKQLRNFMILGSKSTTDWFIKGGIASWHGVEGCDFKRVMHWGSPEGPVLGAQ